MLQPYAMESVAIFPCVKHVPINHVGLLLGKISTQIVHYVVYKRHTLKVKMVGFVGGMSKNCKLSGQTSEDISFKIFRKYSNAPFTCTFPIMSSRLIIYREIQSFFFCKLKRILLVINSTQMSVHKYRLI